MKNKFNKNFKVKHIFPNHCNFVKKDEMSMILKSLKVMNKM